MDSIHSRPGLFMGSSGEDTSCVGVNKQDARFRPG